MANEPLFPPALFCVKMERHSDCSFCPRRCQNHLGLSELAMVDHQLLRNLLNQLFGRTEEIGQAFVIHVLCI